MLLNNFFEDLTRVREGQLSLLRPIPRQSIGVMYVGLTFEGLSCLHLTMCRARPMVEIPIIRVMRHVERDLVSVG